eukprot:6645829-Karenia_brevis.AAC.1
MFFRASPVGDPYRAVDVFSPPRLPRALPEFAFRICFSCVPRGPSVSGGRRLFSSLRAFSGTPRINFQASFCARPQWAILIGRATSFSPVRAPATPRICFQESFFARPPWAILIERATSFPLPTRPLGHSQNSLSGIFFRASPAILIGRATSFPFPPRPLRHS